VSSSNAPETHTRGASPGNRYDCTAVPTSPPLIYRCVDLSDFPAASLWAGHGRDRLLKASGFQVGVKKREPERESIIARTCIHSHFLPCLTVCHAPRDRLFPLLPISPILRVLLPGRTHGSSHWCDSKFLICRRVNLAMRCTGALQVSEIPHLGAMRLIMPPTLTPS
jgi:hypothetical protein